MHWKLKAAIQNIVAKLPSAISYKVYYKLQCSFGGWKNFDPRVRLGSGVNVWRRLLEAGCEPVGKRFFEVGTGRVPLVPLAFWLMGAEKTVTVDLNPYMKDDLIQATLSFVSSHEQEVVDLFGTYLDRSRFDALLEFAESPEITRQAFLDLIQVDYTAPGDAAKTNLPDKSIDFHTSYMAFEHIPGPIIKSILIEGNRLIKDTGVFMNVIDYGDHFAHSDSTLSEINFLQFSDKVWARYADNRYMYMNRLRHDDFHELFHSVGHVIIAEEAQVNSRSRQVLDNQEIVLDERFSSKPVEILEITGAWMISRKK